MISQASSYLDKKRKETVRRYIVKTLDKQWHIQKMKLQKNTLINGDHDDCKYYIWFSGVEAKCKDDNKRQV